MKHLKTVVSITILVAMASLFISNNAMAIPRYEQQAPASSVETCVAKVSAEANYENASRVLHLVETRQLRTRAHTISIDTKVFGNEGDVVIREYVTLCRITVGNRTLRFNLQEKGV